MSFLVIYITHPDEVTAAKISEHLIEKKLVACANLFPIKSIYWWQGNLVNDQEFVSIVKTVKNNFEKVKKAVAEIHPYEVPCITAMKAKANKDYELWIKESVV